MDRWCGKIALVTGAGSGIGAAVTEKLSKAGIKVFGVDISVEKVEDVKHKMDPLLGEILPVRCDIKNNEEVIEAFKLVKNKFGTIHILVNAAGIGRYGLLSDGNVNYFKEIFDVNVMGTIYCTQQAIKLMKESGVEDGHIVFLNSVAGHYVTPQFGFERFNVYGASKHAITVLTETLRQELQHLKSKIRVTSISPGKVRTNFVDNLLAGSGTISGKIYQENLDDDSALEPTDIAEAIEFAIAAPPHVQIHEIIIRPNGKKPIF